MMISNKTTSGLGKIQVLKNNISLVVTAPHDCPSNKTLTRNPHKVNEFLIQTLTKAPQKVWQTLTKFDYPNLSAKS